MHPAFGEGVCGLGGGWGWIREDRCTNPNPNRNIVHTVCGRCGRMPCAVCVRCQLEALEQLGREFCNWSNMRISTQLMIDWLVYIIVRNKEPRFHYVRKGLLGPHACVCVGWYLCVRVCACARVRVCVCACVSVCAWGWGCISCTQIHRLIAAMSLLPQPQPQPPARATAKPYPEFPLTCACVGCGSIPIHADPTRHVQVRCA